MATFYLDFENGNDANDGTTFANRWKTMTNGATAARIAPGDTIRIMGSPAPTSLGINGTWTSGILEGTKAMSNATNATPISITSGGHGYSTGDTVVIEGVTGLTAANGTWEITVTDASNFTLNGSVGNAAYLSGGSIRRRNNCRVMLASAVTQNIACTGPGRTAWTAANANITAQLVNFGKESYTYDNIQIGAGFTTGLAAYWPTGTLNLSAYQQVSFWVQGSGVIGAAGATELRLCSDTAGATAVHTISIPNLVAANRWTPITVDLGTNLSSSIQSIALYVNVDNATNQTLSFNNIIACKASSAPDSLTLTSLIGKNTTGETWWGIQSINGTRVMLDGEVNTRIIDTTYRGYYGTSETVTTWKRETVKIGPLANASDVPNGTTKAGTSGSPITYSGGWDRTNMTTQTLETWVDNQNGYGYGVRTLNEWTNLEKLAAVRCAWGFGFGKFNSHNIIAANNNNSRGVESSAALATSVTLGSAVANGTDGVIFSESISGCSLTINNYVVSNTSSGVNLSASKGVRVLAGTGPAVIANHINFGINGSGSVNGFVSGITMASNSTDVYSDSGRFSDCSFYNCNFNSSSEASTFTDSGSVYKSSKHDQTVNNHKIFQFGALISSATDQRHTASGISWKIQPTNTRRTAEWPVSLPISKVACAANSLVTVKAWMRRDNTALTMRLVCKGGQIAGVAADVTASMTAAANTWEEVTITFTPTEIGVVEITAEAYGGSTYSGWVDDMTISQA